MFKKKKKKNYVKNWYKHLTPYEQNLAKACSDNKVVFVVKILWATKCLCD